MKHRLILAGSLIAGSLLVGGCGAGSAADASGGPPAVTVVGTDTMRYAPDTINVKAGEATTIAFKSGGLVPHDLISEGATKNLRMVNVTPGKQQTGVFEADKPGTYAFYCSQARHREAGMVGKIVVS